MSQSQPRRGPPVLADRVSRQGVNQVSLDGLRKVTHVASAASSNEGQPVSNTPDLTGTPLTTLLDLNGRVAVVTGAGRGIGRSIVERLAEAGATTVVADIDEASAEETATSVQEKWGRPAHSMRVDVADSASVDALADFADGLGDGLAIWVNNAGIYPATPLVDLTDEEWASVLLVTLTGTFNGSRAAARKMVARAGLPGRVIVNISSAAGSSGRENLASYVAAKHGVNGLVRTMAIELGQHGIRVLGVAPSLVDTPGMRIRRETSTGPQAESLEEFERQALLAIPLRRWGVADDIARSVLYCVSDLAEFVTGAIIPVDGGRTAS
jgi:NAD(P)-dependent dehydrogenase (short-subunit alcohol dehydrogenase family)